ncbi:MAG: RNA polymerase sigma factor [Dysgonamonadaceae bacterium]|jgi:RNA polymerase sigma factor (sigma-70 family)|nr:RNA polymerase sigma factor [Dysgonamonadaceae bacterium]
MENQNKHFSDDNTSDEADRLLLASFLKNDEQAFVALYHKYVDELFAYGLGLGFERENIKDAIQDTFFKFYINKQQWKGVTRPKYYLLGMLRNRLIDLYRSVNKENATAVADMPFQLETSVLDDIIEREEKHALEQRVDLLLDLLTERQKEAVYLRFIQELEYEEIGKMLQMTAPAVRKLVSRAVKRMRGEDF